MTRSDYENFKIGDILYECQSGLNIEFRITSKPASEEVDVFDKKKLQWSWSAVNNVTEEVIDYLVTEDISSMYGTRIYDTPEYVYSRRVDGKIEFFHKLVGEK